MVAENARVHTGSLIVMTYQLTIENNRTIAVRTHLGWNLSSFSCVATIA